MEVVYSLMRRRVDPKPVFEADGRLACLLPVFVANEGADLLRRLVDSFCFVISETMYSTTKVIHTFIRLDDLVKPFFMRCILDFLSGLHDLHDKLWVLQCLSLTLLDTLLF